MTSPTFNAMITFIAGSVIATVLPIMLAVAVEARFDSIVLGIVIAIVLIYELMSISFAIGSLMDCIPDSYGLGPSALAGNGHLMLGMLIIPMLFIPGYIWLFILPFDEEGYVNFSRFCSFEPTAIEEPS